MNEYKLTPQKQLKTKNDPAARIESGDILNAVDHVALDADVYLQQVYKGKPPRGIKTA